MSPNPHLFSPHYTESRTFIIHVLLSDALKSGLSIYIELGVPEFQKKMRVDYDVRNTFTAIFGNTS